MRNLILGLLLVSSYSALACEIQRGQFIGKVKGHYDVLTSENSSVCYFQIELTSYNEDATCALSVSDAAQAEYLDSKCALKDGDKITGVIAKNGNYIYIE